MNMQSSAQVAPLTLTERVKGPWLAIRAGQPAEARSIVLVSEDECGRSIWRAIDIEAPALAGFTFGHCLTALADFGISVTMYRHTRVLSVWRSGRSRARFHNHPAGGLVHWAGPDCDRIKLPHLHSTLEAIADAARDCNTLGRVPG